MTENEKLRALLAEAREVVQGVLRAANSTPYAQWSRDQHQAEIVRDAIDAALAEPLEDTQESNTPKCEHGVEYGGIGVGCCPRCDQKALILASTETPKVKA